MISSLRSTSNSTQSLKLKKSNSSQFANKMKSSINNMTNSTNYIDSSLKHNRVNTSSKSNKKNVLQNNHSNKSFKTLNETHSQSRLENNKRTIAKKVEPSGQNQKKGTAINVKNMKQKALGHSNQAMLASYKAHTRHTEEKEN